MKILEDNKNPRTVLTVIVDHEEQTVGIKWLDKKDNTMRGVVLEKNLTVT